MKRIQLFVLNVCKNLQSQKQETLIWCGRQILTVQKGDETFYHRTISKLQRQNFLSIQSLFLCLLHAIMSDAI